MPDTADTLTLGHVQAAIAALAANEVPVDADTKFIDILSCGHTVCVSMHQPPYIILDGDKMEMIKPCCQKALNAKWSKMLFYGVDYD
jgi:hypothetical protein